MSHAPFLTLNTRFRAAPNEVSMLSLLHPATVLKNTQALCHHVQEPAAPVVNSRVRYFRGLNRFQAHALPFHEDERLWLEFDFETAPTRALLARFLTLANYPPRFAPLTAGEMADAREKVPRALELLARLDADVVRSIHHLIGALYFARAPRDAGTYGGGSLSEGLGVLWMRPAPDWTPLDYAESILHETLHNALFLEDMVNGLFALEPEEMLASDARVSSSVRTTYAYKRDPELRRRYDLSYHAAFVSAGLIELHQRVGDAAKASSLREPLPQSLSELDALKAECLEPRGQALLAELRGLS